MLRIAGFTILGLVLASAIPSAAAEELYLSVEGSTVVVEGMSLQKLDTVFFLVVSWPDQPWIPRLMTFDQAVDVEDEGKAVLSWPGGGSIPFRTLVVAVNPRDGSVGYGAPSGFPFSKEELLPGAFVRNKRTRRIEALRIHGRRFEDLIVRPGVGAWRLSGRDGTPEDLDGSSNRQVTSSLNSAVANPRSGPPPAFLTTGDMVYAIDARTMSIIVGGV